MNKYIIVLTLLILAGCVTAESLMKVPDSSLKYYSGGYAENLYRQEIVRRHPEWPEKTRQAVLKGKVFVEMTKEQARAS